MVSTHSGMPATKGFSSLISVQGSSTGKNPEFGTYAQQGNLTAGEMAGDKMGSGLEGLEVLTPVSEGPKTFKFPLDDVSAGNFWTRLIVNSWLPVRDKQEIVPKQLHQLSRFHIANIWLPMPQQLATAYNQTFTESDNIMMNRGTGFDVTSLKGAGKSFFDQVNAAYAQAQQESASFIASMANINNTNAMAKGSVMNQQKGLVYDGATLRKHSLSWKMIPKSEEEQEKIAQVVFALKKYSVPVIKSKGGGDVNHLNTAEQWEAYTKEIAENTDLQRQMYAAGGQPQFKHDQKMVLLYMQQMMGGTFGEDTMRNIGRLGIPATINVEFWFGDAPNPNLFMIKDSFISSVGVNYTPEGGWNAYKDGAPIQTQLTLSLTENAILTQDDVKFAGGY